MTTLIYHKIKGKKMSNKLFIITVFISNITFATVVPILDPQTIINTKSINSLISKVYLQLVNNGLDEQISNTKLNSSLLHSNVQNDIMAQNILKNIPSLKEDSIIDFIAQAVLREQKVDLSSYETIISLVQRHSTALFDKESLQQIEKTSLENEKLKSLKVIV